MWYTTCSTSLLYPFAFFVPISRLKALVVLQIGPGIRHISVFLLKLRATHAAPVHPCTLTTVPRSAIPSPHWHI